MRRGRVKVSLDLLYYALDIPSDWRFDEITHSPGADYIEVIISGSSFPEDNPIKDCKILIHESRTSLEVKTINSLDDYAQSNPVKKNNPKITPKCPLK